MVLGTPYLLMIGLMLVCLNWVNTTGEYILGSVVEDAARAAVAAGTAGGYRWSSISASSTRSSSAW